MSFLSTLCHANYQVEERWGPLGIYATSTMLLHCIMQSIFGGRLAAMWDFMHAEMCNNEAKNQSHVAAGDWFTISDNQ